MSPAGSDRLAVGPRARQQHAVGQPAPARVAGQEEPLVGHAQVAQRVVDGGGVLGAGRVGELGGQAVVGHEDGAVGLPAHPGGEEGVHLGRGADVAAAVQVEDDAGSARASSGRYRMPGTPPSSAGWPTTSSERTTGGMMTLQMSSSTSSTLRNSGIGSDDV